MGLIDQSFFDDLVPKAQDSTSNAGKVSVTIRVDGDCFMMCDGDFVDAEFKANQITKVEIITGQHILEFQSVADPDNVVEKIVDYSENGKSYLLIVQGLGEKSKEEKQENAILEFKKQIQIRLEDDRRIDRREAAELEEIRKNLKIDIKTAHRLINEAREQLRNDAHGIFSREGSTFSVDVLKDAITKDDVDKIRTILPDVATYIESCDSESSEDTLIHYLYFMCMNALEPSTLIKMHESSYVDNYWRTFWTFLAYSRNKQRAKAADLLVYIQDIFLEYPADNINLLRAIDAYNNIGKDEALKCIGDVDGNFSTELVSLVEAIKYELGIDNPSPMEKEEQVAFIQDRVVSYEDHAIRIARKEQKKAELRHKITYTLTITEVKDQMLAMMTVRKMFGWATADTREKFANLPLDVLVTDNKSKAESTYEELTKGGLIVSVKGINALKETIDDCLGHNAVAEELEKQKQIRIRVIDYATKKYGYINGLGQEIIPCQYDNARDFSEGLACVKQDHKYGYIDNWGNFVIPCRYNNAWKFSDDLAMVKQDGKYGYIDKEGHYIIPCQYDDADSFYFGLAQIKMNQKYGFVDKTGREIITCKYDGARNFSEKMTIIEKKGKYGCIDKLGNEIVPCKYDYAENFSEGMAVIGQNKKYGYVDESGHQVVSCKYEDAHDFSEGYAVVRSHSKYGFIDKTGREVIPCRYDTAWFFSDGLARIEINGKYGYINKNGQEVISCKYEDADYFSDGCAYVMQNGKYGFIDKTGREIVPCKYDEVDNFSQGLGKIRMDGKYGYVNKEGRMVTPFKYGDVF